MISNPLSSVFTFSKYFFKQLTFAKTYFFTEMHGEALRSLCSSKNNYLIIPFSKKHHLNLSKGYIFIFAHG